MKKQLALVCTLLVMFLGACIQGSGNVVTESREVGPFAGIAIGGSGELLITIRSLGDR